MGNKLDEDLTKTDLFYITIACRKFQKACIAGSKKMVIITNILEKLDKKLESVLKYLYDGEPCRLEKLQEATDDNNGVIDDGVLLELMEGYLDYFKENSLNENNSCSM